MQPLSMWYMIYLAIVLMFYYCVSCRYQKYVLLIGSVGFYVLSSGKSIGVLCIVLLFTYVMGRTLEKITNELFSRILLLAEAFLVIGCFVYYKYYSFILVNISKIMKWDIGSVENVQRSIPLGMSFFLLSAWAYVYDVYKKESGSYSFCNYSLWFTFFPKMVSGPIERAISFCNQIEHSFQYDNIRFGVIRIIYGFFVKMVIADNIALMIAPVLKDYELYSGSKVFFACLLYSLQIYCDFMGYSEIAIGTARLFGFEIIENFKAPYLATSVTGFWKGWHISLTSWFTKYIYIPLGGSRNGLIRTYVNILIIFGLSGLWHGAAWNYVIWGMLNGSFMILEKFVARYIDKNNYIFSTMTYKIVSRVYVYVAITFTWIFFRSSGAVESIRIIKHIISDFRVFEFFNEGILFMYQSKYDLLVFIISILLVLLVDLLIKRGLRIELWICNQDAVFRWLFYIVMVLIIFTFGVFGDTHGQTEFIYFQF